MLASVAALNTTFLIFHKGLLFCTTLCNYKQYQKLIQERSRSDNEYILFKIAAAASHTAGFCSVHLPAKLLHRTAHGYFSHKHFTR